MPHVDYLKGANGAPPELAFALLHSRPISTCCGAVYRKTERRAE